MKYPKMIIFDYGQTLIQENSFDSLAGETALYQYIVDNPRNVTPEEITEFSGKIYGSSIAVRENGFELHEHTRRRLISEYFGVRYSVSMVEAEKIVWNAAVPGKIMPGTDNMLDYLNSHGIRTAVISNIGWSEDALTDRINHLLPNNRFEFIIASSEYSIRKPNVILFELALRKAGLDAGEVWYCGDTPSADIEGSVKCGIFPVWYNNVSDCIYHDKSKDLIPSCEHLHIHEWSEMVAALEKLESSYENKLCGLYKSVDSILKDLDFNMLWPGFHKYRYAFYNQQEMCFDGKMMPPDDQFLGNTAIEYNGEQIAIWGIEPDEDNTPESLAYSMVHEMFHCFQHDNRETRFPDDLRLLNYPSDLKNFETKYKENRFLINSFINSDISSLKSFCSLRTKRLKQYGSILLEELKAETIEGMAEFIGLKALKVINPDKFQRTVEKYLKILSDDIPMLLDVRRNSYYSGAIFYLAMEQLGFGVKNTFNEITVFEQNNLYGTGTDDFVTDQGDMPQMDDRLSEISNTYTGVIEERKLKITDYISSSVYEESPALICGYDPMNMFRMGDFIFCSHFVFLQGSNGVVRLDGESLLKLQADSDNRIEGYYKSR